MTTEFPPNKAKVCQVVANENWISEIISQTLDQAGGAAWSLRAQNGLAPPDGLSQADALWIAPALLIASNAWLTAWGSEPLRLPSPRATWLAELAQVAPELAGRRIVAAPAKRILGWRSLPSGLGDRPWSQLAQGRVLAFRAAQRSLPELQASLATAPPDSLIQLSSHIPDISEEWRVLLDAGRPIAASGYCLHDPAGGRRIVSVFDGAHFDPARRAAALQAAQAAASAGGLTSGAIDLAFTQSGPPIILEANPLWCAAPYAYGPQGMAAYLDALQSSQADPREPPYAPDPWMRRSFSRRYAAFHPGASSRQKLNR
ncbi:ATP-grasp domain-containing protein [Bifidobacterium actinocoloniiforme]|nr:ATP-grasp domain-containing protein [Bifidobacterium actinocoloniiforme]AKV55861.1 hypothetical protein AB656_06540 [Bifidobacterium actinocoloniiforme DSM 22766]